MYYTYVYKSNVSRSACMLYTCMSLMYLCMYVRRSQWSRLEGFGSVQWKPRPTQGLCGFSCRCFLCALHLQRSGLCGPRRERVRLADFREQQQAEVSYVYSCVYISVMLLLQLVYFLHIYCTFVCTYVFTATGPS